MVSDDSTSSVMAVTEVSRGANTNQGRQVERTLAGKGLDEDLHDED